MNVNEFIKKIESIGFKYKYMHMRNVYTYAYAYSKDFYILDISNDGFVLYKNARTYIQLSSLDNIDSIFNNFKKEVRSIKLKNILK